MTQPVQKTSCCSPGTGIGAYFKVIEQIGLGDDNEQGWLARTMKGVARLILTVIALPFFILAGMLYNGTGAVAKMTMGVVHLIKGNPASVSFDQMLHHLIFGVYDLGNQLIFPITAVVVTLIPGHVTLLHGHIAGFIDETQPFSSCC